MRFLYALIVLLTAATASAQSLDSTAGVTFPARLGQLAYDRKHTFPQKELGIALLYRLPGRPLWATVYIYNLGLATLPSDLADTVVTEAFSKVLGDVKQAASMGQVKDLNLQDETPRQFTAASCGRTLLRTDFQFRGQEGPLKSYALLTTHANHFLKVRISHASESRELTEATEDFLAALSRLLAGCG